MATTGRNSTTTQRNGRAASFGRRSNTLGRIWQNAAAGTQGRLAQRAACGHDSGEETTMRLDWITQQLNIGDPRGNLPPRRRIPKTPRHRSRLAEGGRNNIKKSNVKWLTPSFLTLSSSHFSLRWPLFNRVVGVPELVSGQECLSLRARGELHRLRMSFMVPDADVNPLRLFVPTSHT